MANRLKMAPAQSIHTLYQQGWSQRRIARELGINRETVARHLKDLPRDPKPANAPIGSGDVLDGSNPAIAPTGSGDGADGSNPAIAPTGPDPLEGDTKPTDLPFSSETHHASLQRAPGEAGRPSECEPWRDQIVEKLELGLSAQRIYQDLVTDYGFSGSYFSVRRFVRRLQVRTGLPVRRLECEPGEEAQVDFGTGAPLIGPDGKRRRTHVLRIVLSCSRKAYSQAVTRQTTENFLVCLENAFRYFGGVPKRLILDNLKAAVQKADWFDPDLNPKIQAFAEHYGIAILPTRPYKPQHKGKVERGVGYVQDNGLKGRKFASLDEQNQFLLDWERTVADTRIHGTTRHQVGKFFTEVEKPLLQPLPLERFPFFHEQRRAVHRDGHIEVDHAYYSVPPEYLGRRVWVRWDARMVRVFNDRMEQIAVHPKHEPGRFSTDRRHIASEKITGVERGTSWLLSRVRMIGPHSTRWAEATIQARGVQGVRVVQGLLSLTHRHHWRAIEQACQVAHGYRSFRLKTIRALIDRQVPSQEQFEFMTDHPIIRQLSEYDQFVHEAFQKEA
jgi:transposase